ncbi:MAG: hypothetical protein ACLGIK_16805, partial [Gemmatimonadota bacterium]
MLALAIPTASATGHQHEAEYFLCGDQVDAQLLYLCAHERTTTDPHCEEEERASNTTMITVGPPLVQSDRVYVTGGSFCDHRSGEPRPDTYDSLHGRILLY